MKLKKGVYLLISLGILIGIIITINALIAGTEHSGEHVIVTVKGIYTMTLQEAVRNNYLREGGVSPTQSLTNSVSFGHNANTIRVYIDGATMSLQEAINTGNLCSSTTTSSAPALNPGHSATEIEILVNGVTKSLQAAINAKDFCASGSCGDDVCNNGETSTTCPADCPPSLNDCTTSATFGTGVTQFTVQPVASSGTTKTGTCKSGYCDGLPTARCNSGTWVEESNTCRAPNLIWVSYAFPGPVTCFNFYPGNGCTGTCTSEGAGCAIYCESGIILLYS